MKERRHCLHASSSRRLPLGFMMAAGPHGSNPRAGRDLACRGPVKNATAPDSVPDPPGSGNSAPAMGVSRPTGVNMGRFLLLWLLGIPLPILIVIWLLGGFH
jgi:hypothetical protein